MHTKPADRRDPDFKRLAGAAFYAAVQDRFEDARAHLAKMNGLFTNAAGEAALLWIDTLIAQAGGPPAAAKVALAFQTVDPGEPSWRPLESADEVPAQVAWAGRLIVARATGDEETFVALFNAAGSRDDFGSHMATLLQMAATNYARGGPVIMRGGRRGDHVDAN